MNIPGAGVIVNHETTGGELVYEEKGKQKVWSEEKKIVSYLSFFLQAMKINFEQNKNWITLHVYCERESLFDCKKVRWYSLNPATYNKKYNTKNHNKLMYDI